ncbi:3-coathanger stack domain-containing protein [Flavobacterium sp. RHBU_24]|uniref:3-coathanger stack domain-containing protein n=1 Tax=Flavobacterium sp. RHBU_24 TaxID=3391185 RepID=UPI003984CD4A
MKNVYFIILMLICCIKGYSQADIIIWLDNSDSIDNTEFANMKTSIQSIISQTLECNNNKVAVVHYGGQAANGSARIYIESDFTDNTTLANSFIKRTTNVGGNDYAHEALALVGNALDGIANASIVSPQTVLNHDPTRKLIIFLFTDAYRSSTFFKSFLVNTSSPTLNNNAAFLNYTNFKNSRNAKFVITKVPQGTTNEQNQSMAAAAGIATQDNGAPYTGTVESYSADPGGAGIPNRYLFSTDFVLTSTQLNSVTYSLCNLSYCPYSLNFSTLAGEDVMAGQLDNQHASVYLYASNVINANAEANYFSGNLVELNDGFYAAGNSLFLAKIVPCEYNQVSQAKRVAPAQNIADVITTKEFILLPNPVTDIATITAPVNIIRVSVMSSVGIVLSSTAIPEKSTEYKLDFSNFNSGIYFTVVETEDGKTHSFKTIKN